MTNKNATANSILDDVHDDLDQSAKDFVDTVWPDIKFWFNGIELYPVEVLAEKEEKIVSELLKNLDTLSGIDYWVLVKKRKNGKTKLDPFGSEVWHGNGAPVKEETDKGMEAVASRVQYMDQYDRDEPWNTFTVRYERESGQETELEKRKRAIEYGFTSPHWAIHAYLDKEGGKLLTVGMCLMSELISYVDKNKENLQLRKSDDNGHKALFFYVPWSNLKNEGVTIKTRDCRKIKI